ncbi:MAG: nucleotidyltransferase domain-containing protein [Deltaproteobacteria bacterium]
MAEIPAEIEKIIFEYIHNLKKEINVKSVILFGSYAKSSWQKDSDIDLAVFSNAFSRKDRADSIAFLLEKAMPYGLDIQPIAFDEDDFENYQQNPFINEIVTTGIRIT